MQVAEPPEGTLAGVQESELRAPGPNKDTVALCAPPLTVAVIVAIWLAVIVPAVAVKAVETAPEATETEAGTTRMALLLARPTAAPPPGATPYNDTMQFVEAPEPIPAGAHEIESTTGSTTSDSVAACELLLYAAVIVALWLPDTVPVDAVNIAVCAPEATVTEAGTVSPPRLVERATTAPPFGAICVSVTMQLELPPLDSTVGIHDTELTVAGGIRATVAVCDAPLYVAVTTAV